MHGKRSRLILLCLRNNSDSKMSRGLPKISELHKTTFPILCSLSVISNAADLPRNGAAVSLSVSAAKRPPRNIFIYIITHLQGKRKRKPSAEADNQGVSEADFRAGDAFTIQKSAFVRCRFRPRPSCVRPKYATDKPHSPHRASSRTYPASRPVPSQYSYAGHIH